MRELKQILATSRASEPFKRDVLSFFERGEACRLSIEGYVPSVKIARLLKHLLHSEPDLAIERVSLRGFSGCADFVGTVEAETVDGTHSFEFVWDCRWRAQQEGWVDYFGLPDQIRAAQEFDWRCFKVWRSAAIAT